MRLFIHLAFVVLGLGIGWAAARCTVCGMNGVPAADERTCLTGGLPAMLPPGCIHAPGVQTSVIRRSPLVRTLRFAGKFVEDATLHTVISAPVEGRLDGLGLVNDNGKITQRQPLANVFSRTLLKLAEEYKDALLHNEGGAAAVRKQLSHRGLIWEQIQTIPLRKEEDSHFLIMAPHSGTVVRSYVAEGQYVRDGEKLFEITDLSKLWFMFPVPERDLSWFEVGQIVEIEPSAIPSAKIKARVAVVEKSLDASMRIAHVMLEVPNPRGALRLNAGGVCALNVQTPEMPVVPCGAVLWPGSGPHVYVERSPGVYELRTVLMGRAGDRDRELLDGLKEGDRVVADATLLTDGQAPLAIGR